MSSFLYLFSIQTINTFITGVSLWGKGNWAHQPQEGQMDLVTALMLIFLFILFQMLESRLSVTAYNIFSY